MKKKHLLDIAKPLIVVAILGILSFVSDTGMSIYKAPDNIKEVKQMVIQNTNQDNISDSLCVEKNKVQNQLILEDRISFRTHLEQSKKRDSTLFEYLEKMNLKINIVLKHNKKAAQDYERINELLFGEVAEIN